MDIKNILFDLDGTLTDPKEGVVNSIQYALDKLGRPVPEPDDLLWCIGPPLHKSFEKIVGQDSEVSPQAALDLYRERYRQGGKFENELYEDIPEVLSALNDMGFSMYVATSKPQIFAREIADHFDISKYFKNIYGPMLSGELSDKGELIAHILSDENLNYEQTLMVGDRKYDVNGARKSDIKSIGVTFGYGSEDELVMAGASYLAHSPLEILDVVKGITGKPSDR